MRHSDEFEQAEPLTFPAAICAELLTRALVGTRWPMDVEFGAALSFGAAAASASVALAVGSAELATSGEATGAGSRTFASVPSVGRGREQASNRKISNVEARGTATLIA